MLRLGLAASGGVMLAGAFAPCLEIFGESASAFVLAKQGMAFPWLWIILALSALLPLVALFVRPPRVKVLAGLAAAAGPLVLLVIAREKIGPSLWLILRTGSWLLLVGAAFSLILAVLLAACCGRRT